MGLVCGGHLADKIRDYARDAENGSVTVTPREPGRYPGTHCDYCTAPAAFSVSYYPEKKAM